MYIFVLGQKFVKFFGCFFGKFKTSKIHSEINWHFKDFVVDDYIAKAIGFTNGLNSTMFSTEDYARLRNIRLSHV